MTDLNIMQFNKEHYDNVERLFLLYYTKEHIKEVSVSQGDKYSESEILLLHNVANGFFKSFVIKKLKGYINYNYKIVVSYLNTLIVNINSISDTKQRLAFEVRNEVLKQLILFVIGEFETDENIKSE